MKKILKKLLVELLYIFSAFMIVLGIATSYEVYSDYETATTTQLIFGFIIGVLSVHLLIRSIKIDIELYIKTYYPNILNDNEKEKEN